MNRRLFCAIGLLLFPILASPGLAQQTVLYNGRAAVASEVIVRLRNSDNNAMTRVRRAANGAQFEELNKGLALHLVRSGNNNLAGLLQALSNQPDVLYVEPNYIVQAATNLSAPNWISVVTNTSPFTYVESNASLLNRRFFRAKAAK